MKKFLAIMAAAALITSVFAAEPAANVGVAKFDGSASVKWGVDLDAEKTGFTNSTTGDLEFTLFAKGDKATSSDADIWGEIKIEGAELKGDKEGIKTSSISVKTAKLHIGPAYINILKGDTQVGDIAPVMAVNSDNGVYKVGPVGKDAAHGVTLGLDLDGIANFELDVRSAEGYTNKYAMAFQADVKAIDNLTLNAGVAMDINTDKDKDDVAIFGKAAYEMALTDVFYIKPQAGISYDMTKAKDAKDKTSIMAALLFGWNKSENQSSRIYFIENKVSNGASVAILANGDDLKDIALTAGIWDSATLVDNLTFGVSYENKNFNKDRLEKDTDDKVINYSTVIAEAKYVVAVADGKVTPKAGVKVELEAKKGEVKAGVECAGFVPYTTFSVDYANKLNFNEGAKATKGTIDLTCKIAF